MYWLLKIEEKKITCPNKVCAKILAMPLSTLNIQQSSKETYNACPHCLTEITVYENKKEGPPEATSAEVVPTQEAPGKNQDKAIFSKHYLGYLSDKEKREQFPEECMFCGEILQCMLKKMRA